MSALPKETHPAELQLAGLSGHLPGLRAAGDNLVAPTPSPQAEDV